MRNNPYGYEEEQDDDAAHLERLREIAERAMRGEWKRNPRLNPAPKLVVGRVITGEHGSVMVVQDRAGFDVVVVVGEQARIVATTPRTPAGRQEALRTAEKLCAELG